jgi:hypothetical protein
MFLLAGRTGRILAIVVLLSLTCVWASAMAADPPRADIQVQQLPRSEFDIQQRGAVSVAYAMAIRNLSQEPITLRQVRMKTVGRSPYALKDGAVSFDERIEPGQEATVTFSLWAYPRSGQRGSALVWVRGSASFEDAGGAFEVRFSRSFREPD